MKISFLLMAILIGTVVMTQPGKQLTGIIITKTGSYCGGANPPQHILDELEKKKIPFGEKFYIIKGSCNESNRKIIDTLVFDSSGKRTVMLKPGCYSIINDFGLNKPATDTTQFDMNCLLEEWKKPLFTFEVRKGKNETFSHNIHEICPHNMPCRIGKIALPM